MPYPRPLAVAACATLLCACGERDGTGTRGAAGTAVPIPIGRGPAFSLPAVSPGVARAEPIRGLRCTTSHPRFYAVHLELFAKRLVVPVPAGIGVAPPQRRSGAYVLGGRCSYPIRTFEPTGVVVLDAGPRFTLSQLFAVWRQPLSRRRLAGFKGPVLAFFNGRRWQGAPGQIPLTPHAEIVLEIDGLVAPHESYTFPQGL